MNGQSTTSTKNIEITTDKHEIIIHDPKTTDYSKETGQTWTNMDKHGQTWTNMDKPLQRKFRSLAECGRTGESTPKRKNQMKILFSHYFVVLKRFYEEMVSQISLKINI